VVGDIFGDSVLDASAGYRRLLRFARHKSDPVFLDTVWTTMTAAKEAGHEAGLPRAGRGLKTRSDPEERDLTLARARIGELMMQLEQGDRGLKADLSLEGMAAQEGRHPLCLSLHASSSLPLPTYTASPAYTH
jgi:hypothetical protein